MSISALILINVGAAAIVTAILVAVMLVPTRLHRPFAAGHTERQKVALRRHLWRTASGRHRPQRASQRGLRPIPDQQ